MAEAIFTVNGDSPEGGVAVSASSTVDLALVSTFGVRSVAWTIEGNHSPDATNPTITPAGSPSGATASFAMPSGDGQAYIIQAVVNNGVDELNRTVSAQTFRAVVGVNNLLGRLPLAAGETTERSETHGYVPALNDALATASGVSASGTPANLQVAVFSSAAAIGGSDTFTTTTSPGNGRTVTVGGTSTTGTAGLTLTGDSTVLVMFGDDGNEIASWSGDADAGTASIEPASGKALSFTGAVKLAEASGTPAAVADQTILKRRTEDGATIMRAESGIYEAAISGTATTSSTTPTQIADLYLEADTYAALSLVLTGVNRGTPGESCIVNARVLLRCDGSNAVTAEESDLTAASGLPSSAPTWVGANYNGLITINVGTNNHAKVHVTAGSSATVKWAVSGSALVTEDAAS